MSDKEIEFNPDTLCHDLDAKEEKLIKLISGEHLAQIDSEDVRLDEFADDRGREDDTINRLINKKFIRQVGPDLSDTAYLVLE